VDEEDLMILYAFAISDFTKAPQFLYGTLS